MTIAIIEPILARLTVSLINKWIFNNTILWLWCYPPTFTEFHEDESSSTNATVSDMSLGEAHVHVHSM